MRLKSFRVFNCFGFADSGLVDLDPPEGVVLLLGRNSSGKTSLLQALRHFGTDLIPNTYKNFANFNPTESSSRLVTRFSIEPGELDPATLLEQVKAKLQSLGLPPEVFQANDQVKKLFEVITNVYEGLAHAIRSTGEAWVVKSATGDYYFHSKGRGTEEYNERNAKLTRVLQQTFPGNRFRHNNTHIPIAANIELLENELFRQFPSVIFFGDSYRLSDDLPDRITRTTLRSTTNALEAAFINYIGTEDASRFLNSNDPDEREEQLKTLRSKAKQLCDRINQHLPSTLEIPELISIVLHEKEGLQITVKADQKKAFYRHLSDNTKILFAYHLFALSEPAGDRVLLFDEPNTGFHPSAQAFLVEFLKSLAVAGNQAVVSTHSEYMVDLDALPGVRLMGADSKGMLTVENHPYQHREGKGNLLGLQPILDAIGLRYGVGLTFGREVVLVEGVTDLLYLRAMNRVLGMADDLAIAPTRGDAHILTLLPFFIGQGIGIRVLLDAGGSRERIQSTYGIGDEFVFEVPVPDEFRDRVRNSGIEDLFSRADFKRLAEVGGVDLGDPRRIERLPNSALVKASPAKRILAHQLVGRSFPGQLTFDEETEGNFRRALTFCRGETWFTL